MMSPTAVLATSLLAVGAGIAVAALLKPQEHLASGHLVGVGMARQGRHQHGGRGYRSYIPNWYDAFYGGIDLNPTLVVIPDPETYGYTYLDGQRTAPNGERLVAFQQK